MAGPQGWCGQRGCEARDMFGNHVLGRSLLSPVCRSLSMCCSPRVPVSNAHSTSLSHATQDELRRKHKGYLAENPDVNRLLNDLMSQVLFHKPDDIFAFAAEKFNSFERKVRPKWLEKVGGRDGGGVAGNKGNGNAATRDGRRGGTRI